MPQNEESRVREQRSAPAKDGWSKPREILRKVYEELDDIEAQLYRMHQAQKRGLPIPAEEWIKASSPATAASINSKFNSKVASAKLSAQAKQLRDSAASPQDKDRAAAMTRNANLTAKEDVTQSVVVYALDKLKNDTRSPYNHCTDEERNAIRKDLEKEVRKYVDAIAGLRKRQSKDSRIRCLTLKDGLILSEDRDGKPKDMLVGGAIAGGVVLITAIVLEVAMIKRRNIKGAVGVAVVALVLLAVAALVIFLGVKERKKVDEQVLDNAEKRYNNTIVKKAESSVTQTQRSDEEITRMQRAAQEQLEAQRRAGGGRGTGVEERGEERKSPQEKEWHKILEKALEDVKRESREGAPKQGHTTGHEDDDPRRGPPHQGGAEQRVASAAHRPAQREGETLGQFLRRAASTAQTPRDPGGMRQYAGDMSKVAGTPRLGTQGHRERPESGGPTGRTSTGQSDVSQRAGDLPETVDSTQSRTPREQSEGEATATEPQHRAPVASETATEDTAVRGQLDRPPPHTVRNPKISARRETRSLW